MSLKNSFGKVVFKILAKMEMTRNKNKNRLFGRHFETVQYFILFYFILFCFILFYFILFYFILFYFILFYFILFYFILFHFIYLFVYFCRIIIF